MKLCTRVLIAPVAAVALTACQVEKSANPLSPTVAGPIEGVNISTPHLLEPGQDWQMKSRDQPLKLLIQNAGSNGVRPLKYTIEVATDSAFKNIIFARTNVESGADGRTSLQLPDKLAAGTYWWRTRADDGANASPYSDVKSFQVLADVVLSPPNPESPSTGPIPDLTPTFVIRAGNRSGTTSDLEYTLQVSSNANFSPIVATFVVMETGAQTTIDQNYSFLYGRTYYWRVRARHTADSELSNWSVTRNFRTPDAPAAPAPAPSDPGTSPDPDPNPSNPSICNSNDGDDIADCIEARYPQYLAANVSLSRREENTKFLRNKIIEHAKCRGLDVGLNLKRGGPEISVDFIAWRRSGRTEGVDVVSGWDDTKRRLNLTWHTYGPPNYGHPYYKDYGPVSCN